MHRPLIAVFTTLVLGGAALLSCSDRSATPTEADRSLAGSSLQNDIQTLINALFGKPGGLSTAANSQWKNIKKKCPQPPTSPSTDCQTKVFNLIDFTNEKLAGGKLKDPPSGAGVGIVPATTEEAALLLQLFLLQYAGFDVSGIDPEAEDLVIVVCQPGEPCLVVTPNEHSGVFLPADACDTPCTIIGQKIDETQFFPTDGPLSGLTDFDQFPLFYDWTKFEAGETPTGLLAPSGLRLAQDFNVPVEIALCVVEEGPYAPDSSVVSQLQLAHPHPDSAGTIELVPVDPANNVPLDCTNATAGDPPSEIFGLAPASRRLTLASPGKLGGAISSFSPFAAVDPESGSESTTTTLDIDETFSPNTRSLFDGDVATMHADVSPMPDNDDLPQVTFRVLNSGTEFSDSHTATTDDGDALADLGCDGFSYSPVADIVISPVSPDTSTYRVFAEFEGSPGFAPSVSDTVYATCNDFSE